MQLLNNKIVFLLLGILVGVLLLSMPFKFAVITVIGILVVALILFSPETGFLLIVAVIPFEMLGVLTATGPEGGGVTGFQTLSIIKILAIFTLLSWIIKVLRTRTRIHFAPQLIVLAVLILVAIFSYYSSTYSGVYFEKKAKSYLFFYIMYFGVFFMALNIVRSEMMVKKIISVFIITGVITSLFSFVQLYVPSFHKEVITVEDDNYRLYGAVLDPSEEATLGKIRRTSSGMLGHDMTALFLALTIALSLYRLELLESAAAKMGWTIILAIQFLGLLLTYSRGGTYMLIIIILLMIIRRIITPSWEKILITFAALSILVMVILGSTTAINRMFSPEHLKQSGSVSSRIELIQAGWNMLNDGSWITGVGMGNFDYNLPGYSKTLPFVYEPNNEFLRIITEMGLVGIIFSLALWGLTFKDFWKAEKNFQAKGQLLMYNLTKTLEISFIGFLFFGLTQTTVGRKEWPLVMALAIVLKKLSNRPEAGDEKIF